MRILAALSGGVDSAVAASRLLGQGAGVVGVHLRTGVEADDQTAGGGRSCCGADDARDARAVAERLGIPFYVVDVSEAFATVLDEFVAAYAAGRTPNPCVTCNARVKFGRLLEIAHELGCEAVATGHYARVLQGTSGRWRLLRAVDRRKDQTYVLHRLTQAQLAAARFPLGDTVSKGAVREEAAALGLEVATKRDSQDLCFVPQGGPHAFLREHAPESLVPGPVIDADGHAIGAHEGAAAFTRGQRKGLPAVGRPRYVTSVDATGGRVQVGSREALEALTLEAHTCNWIEEPEPEPGAHRSVTVQIRHASAAVEGRLAVTASGGVRVSLEEAAFAPCPGQALVAWQGDAVLCGGTLGVPGT